jgi:hypothetical protein
MTTEPGFPVRITRGVPVVTAPEETGITNAGQLLCLAFTLTG